MCFHDILDLVVSVSVYYDLVHNFEAGFLTHGLDLADDLTYESLFDQFRCQVCIKDYGCFTVRFGYIAFCLCCFNKKVFFCKFYIVSVDIQFQDTVGSQLVHCCCSIDVCESLSDSSKEFTVFRSYCTKLWFEAVGDKGFYIICEFYFFDIQFVCDDVSVEFTHFLLSFYIHGSDRLTVLDVCCISAGTSQNYDLQKLFHVCFQIFVDPCFVYSWEVAEMDTLRSIFIHASYQVLIDVFCHERDHRSCCLGDGYQCMVQSHVSIDLILLHSLCPETFTASSYIPVTHLIYKFLECSCCFRDLVVCQIIVYSLNSCV